MSRMLGLEEVQEVNKHSVLPCNLGWLITDERHKLLLDMPGCRHVNGDGSYHMAVGNCVIFTKAFQRYFFIAGQKKTLHWVSEICIQDPLRYTLFDINRYTTYPQVQQIMHQHLFEFINWKDNHTLYFKRGVVSVQFVIEKEYGRVERITVSCEGYP